MFIRFLLLFFIGFNFAHGTLPVEEEESGIENHIYHFKHENMGKAYLLCTQIIEYEREVLESASLSLKKLPKKNIETISHIRSMISEVDKNPEDKCDFILKKLLHMRLSFLSSRSQIIVTDRLNKKHRGKSTNTIQYGPTDPRHRDFLSSKEKKLAQGSTNRYQFINQMILYVWEMIPDKSTLSKLTLDKLTCSPGLQELLERNRTDLGHPDEIPLDMWNNTKAFSYGDVGLYQKHFLDGDGKPTDPHSVSLSYPNWIKKFLPKGKPVRKSPQELGYGLSVQAKKPTKTRRLTNKQRKRLRQKAKWAEKRKQREFQEEAAKNPEKALERIPETISKAPQKEILSIDKDGNIVWEAFKFLRTTVLRETSAEEMKEQEKEEVEEAEPEVSLSPSSTVVPAAPSGIRKFHAQQEAVTISLFGSLTKKHQGTIENIFTPQKENSISYGDFKKLWLHLHGPKSVQNHRGGSHRTFISKDGQKFGFFVHSEGMKYTKKTIRYVRHALASTGYQPN